MVKLILVFSLLLTARPALSQESSAIPEPRAWADSLPDAFWTSTPGLLRAFSITHEPAKAKKWKAITDKMIGLGFLQFVPQSNLAFFSLLNQTDSSADSVKDNNLEFGSVQLILKEEGDKLNFQTVSKGALKSLGKFGSKKADRATSEAFYQWLSSKLGYDAIVIEQKGEYILAALNLNKTELGQGLLIKKSSKKLLLKAGKVEGEALLQMLKVDKEFAVFEVLLASGGSSKILPATKILLGQSEQLKQMLAPQKADGAAAAPEPQPEGEAEAKETEPEAPAP